MRRNKQGDRRVGKGIVQKEGKKKAWGSPHPSLHENSYPRM